jgi:hypothetical protein
VYDFPYTVFLSFLDEFFPALGAGDGDFSFSFGHPYLLAATGTVEIAVVPVFQLIHQHQEFSIFLVTLVGIPGEGTEHGPDHEAVSQSGQCQIYRIGFDKHGNHARDHASRQNAGIEFVRSVSAGHKPGQTHPKLHTDLPQPISKSIHISITHGF